MNVKYADWLNKREAADRLRVSERTIMRYADEGLIQQKMRPKRGSRDIAVFHPGDIERLAQEKAAERPFVMPPAPLTSAPPTDTAIVPAAPTDSAISPVTALPPASQAFAEALGREIARALTAVKPSDQIFTPAEAAIYSKRSVGRLRELRQQKQLPNAGTEGRVLYRRADLDKL